MVALAMAALLGVVILSDQYMVVSTALFLIVLILLLYVCILSGIALRAKKQIVKEALQHPPGPLPYPPPFVSIIVPSKNEEKVISATITNLRRLQYGDPQSPAYEILVVDDASTDRTYSVISSIAANDPVVRALHRRPGAIPGKSAVLNEAFTRSRGEYIAVFDADARVAPDFLQHAISHFARPTLAAVQTEKRTINAYKAFDVDRPEVTVRHPRRWSLPYFQEIEMLADSIGQVGRELQHGITELRGNGEIFRREALLEIGGWNNETLTDDLDISTRLHIAGWEIHFAPEILVWEEGVTNWKGLWRQRRRWTEGSIRRHLDYLPALLKSPIPLSKKIDAIVFVSEFTFTPWVVLSIIVACLQFLLTGIGDFFPVLVALSILLFTLPPAAAGLVSDLKLGPLAIFLDLIGFLLYILHWPLVVSATIASIIVRRKRFTWAKTEHVGHA